MDDTLALQNALNSLNPGDTLNIGAGNTYEHNNLVKVTKPNVNITGGGTVLATNESLSGFWIMADNVTVDGPTFKMGTTTKRWVAFEQMKLRLGTYTGIKIRNVTIDSSAAAGVYVRGTTNFELTNLLVKNTRADGIHITGASSFGTVNDPVVQGVGDDGVAVVSYAADGVQVHDITVNNARVENQIWGRGISVVGGYNIVHNNPYVYRSAGACVYVASESEFNSYGVNNVTLNGGSFVECNQQAAIDPAQRPSPNEGRVVHGAVMVYNSQPNMDISNVTVKNITVQNTDLEGYDQIVLNDANTTGGSISKVELNGINITGGSRYNFKAVNTPSSAYRNISWTRDGVALADLIGW